MQHESPPLPQVSELSFPTDPTGLPEATGPQVLDARRRRHAEPSRRPRRQAASTTAPCGCSATTARSPAPPCASGRDRRSSSTSPTTATWTPPCTGTGCGWRTSTTGCRTRPSCRSRSAAASPTASSFPDPGLYWYHPHIREDYTQEMGLYGNILVEPAEPGLLAAGPPGRRADPGRRAAGGRQDRLLLGLGDQLRRHGPVRQRAAHRRRDRPGADGASRRGAPAVVDQHRQHPGLQRPAARRPDEARRRGQRPDGARGVRLRGAAGTVRAGGRRRPARPARAADPGTPHPEPRPTRCVDHRDRGARRSRRWPTSSSSCARAPELAAERQQLDAWLAAPPDKILALVAEMDDPTAAQASAGPTVYACPMHPEVTSDQPGRCPKCGMKLLATAPDYLRLPDAPRGHQRPAGPLPQCG